jgi:hypothetical protein
MTVPILTCECGLRLKAPGAVPGQSGCCPRCGTRLWIPDPAGPAAPVSSVQEEMGYPIAPLDEAFVQPQRSARPKQAIPPEPVIVEAKVLGPMADGLLPVLAEPEKGWLASILYPLRGAEGVGMVVFMAPTFWICTILIPEYFLMLQTEAGLLGELLGVISSIPVLILFPLVLSYWLQYVGRVLVSSAMGEPAPPRMPDRNFEGITGGLRPWFIWLVLGVPGALLPLLAYSFLLTSVVGWNPLVALGLGALGFPYGLMALMMTFLHDNELAARPLGVLGAMFRSGGSFLSMSGFIAAMFGIGAATFAGAFLLRAGYFWFYVLACLVGWFVMHWIAIVAMRVMGTYYFRRKGELRWHHERPRWGVTWRL